MTSESIMRPIPAAEPSQTRNFGVSDAMFLIASAALAIWGGSKHVENLAGQLVGLCRIIAAHGSALYTASPQSWRDEVAMRWSTVLWYGFQVFEVLVLSLTPAFLLVRMRRPRRSIRAMLRQPGTVAGLAVIFGYFWVMGWLHRLFFGGINFECGIAIAVGGTVAVAWTLLVLCRQWETEPNWVDRMGRLIGAAAIAVAVLAFAQFGILEVSIC